jgi:hypothetical protein
MGAPPFKEEKVSSFMKGCYLVLNVEQTLPAYSKYAKLTAARLTSHSRAIFCNQIWKRLSPDTRMTKKVVNGLVLDR